MEGGCGLGSEGRKDGRGGWDVFLIDFGFGGVFN